MKTNEEIITKLKEFQSETPSRWRENAEWRMKNKSWLRYSQLIAMRVLDKLDQLGMTQKQLAERLECSQQYVSKILKGQENLSLETIVKLQEALDFKLILIPYAIEGYESGAAMVADSGESEYTKISQLEAQKESI